MSISPQDIRERIRAALPDAEVAVTDTTGGGDHFSATVVSAEFAGKGPVDRHRLVYAALGDADRAFEFLQRAFEGHDEDLPYVAIEPAFDKLHADRRYKELLRKMRLPD
jgi:stress-induced morphogen